MACSAYAGDTTSIKTGCTGFYAGVSFTPGIGYRYLVENKGRMDMVVTNRQIINNRNSYERPSFSYAVGFKVGYRIRHFVAVESGVEYASVAYQYRNSNLRLYTGYRPDLSYDSTTVGSVSSKYGYHYFNIPLACNFTLGKNKVKAVISTGMVFNLLVGQWSQSRYSIPGDESGTSYNTTTKTGRFNRFNVSPFLGVGADWYFKKQMILRVMPVAGMQVMRNTNTPVTEYLYTAGINMSLLFGFGRCY